MNKVERKQRDFTPAWREAMRLMFLARGVKATGKPMWAKPQRQSLAQIADALVKLRQIGVPYEFLWAEAGASPEQIVEWTGLRGLPSNPPPGATASDAPPAAPAA